MTLREAWEAEAGNWLAWAREPGHDTYWRFHRDQFLQLLPPPPAVLLDVGCGEGRLPRDLKAAGYEVVGVDGSSTLIGHAHEADPEGDYLIADAAALPLGSDEFDIVTAFMSLQDVDELEQSVRQIARVLRTGGHACLAVVHPMNSAGKFEDRAPTAPFIIRDSYFESRLYSDLVERDGLRMTFTSFHRPLQAYANALEGAGLLIERLVEVPDASDPPGDRWQRMPLFLHLRARKL
jgi:ubiquinone/menaquinone biosynthesis C-methylase UbiE